MTGLVGGCLLLAAPARTQPQPLEIDVALHAREVLRLEPIYLVMKIRNVGQEPLHLVHPEYPGSIEFEANEVGRGRPLPRAVQLGFPEVLRTWQIEPGGTRRAVFNLAEYFDVRSAVGKYDVRFIYRRFHPDRPDAGPETPFEKVLELVIRQPQGDDNKVAHFIGAGVDGTSFRPKSYMLAAPVILQFYPHSGYRRYVHYWAGLMMQDVDRERAIALLDKHLETWPDFPLADEVRFLQLEIRLRQGVIKEDQRLAAVRALLEKTEDLQIRQQLESAVRREEKRVEGWKRPVEVYDVTAGRIVMRPQEHIYRDVLKPHPDFVNYRIDEDGHVLAPVWRCHTCDAKIPMVAVPYGNQAEGSRLLREYLHEGHPVYKEPDPAK